MIRQTFSRLCMAFLAASVLSACDRTVLLRGAVFDVSGHALPGVAVTIPGVEYQAVTNTLGRYSLRCAPGALELHFIKTGYTSGKLRVDATGPGTLEAASLYLWPVPEGKGVYFFQNDRYRTATRTEAKRYAVKGAGAVYAIKIEPDLIWTLPAENAVEPEERPLIIAYRLPAYDIALCRLEQVEGTPVEDLTADAASAMTDTEKNETAARKFSQKVWIPDETLNIIVAPIDEPEGLLLDIHPIEALSPGIYAVHWGALDGFFSTEPRVFLFQIDPPPETIDPEGEVLMEDLEETDEETE
jgi:hypothetical protein